VCQWEKNFEARLIFFGDVGKANFSDHALVYLYRVGQESDTLLVFEQFLSNHVSLSLNGVVVRLTM